MLEIAGLTDLSALQDLFARANDTRYDLPAVAAEKCFSPGYLGVPRTVVARAGGRLVGAAVTCGRHLRILAVDPKERRNGIGSALLEDAETIVASSSKAIEVASEAGNYFLPGIPDDLEQALEFFAHRGYVQKDHAINLSVDLRNNPRVPAAIEENAQIRRATRQQRELILSWIRDHFGRIWEFEAAGAFSAEPATLFIAEIDGTIAGFSAHDVNNRGLGFFGPEGVDSSIRNKGFGRALLLASLADLRLRGYDRAIIPWASSADFYAKGCGASESDRLVIVSKLLEKSTAAISIGAR